MRRLCDVNHTVARRVVTKISRRFVDNLLGVQRAYDLSRACAHGNRSAIEYVVVAGPKSDYEVAVRIARRALRKPVVPPLVSRLRPRYFIRRNIIFTIREDKFSIGRFLPKRDYGIRSALSICLPIIHINDALDALALVVAKAFGRNIRGKKLIP